MSSGVGSAAAPRTLRGSEGDLHPKFSASWPLVGARSVWAGPYVVLTRLVWVRRVAIAVRPNIFLRVVGRGAAVLGCCCQPLRHFSPSLLGSCSTNRSHGAAGGVSIMAHHYARPRISSL